MLVCREYHVCRRCGDREEMYRNEQILVPEEPTPDATDGEQSSGVGSEADTTGPAEVETADVPAADAAGTETVVSAEAGTDSPAREGADDTRQAVADGAGTASVEDDAIILSGSSTDPVQGTSDGPTESTDQTPTHDGAVGTAVWTTSEAETGTDGDGLRCRNCDVEWRDRTTLRDGDLCPECRIGYVER